jgi:hypothetical protein
MKHDRELMKFAKLSVPLEKVAEQMGREPDLILKRASRLGLTFHRSLRPSDAGPHGTG